jgi:hypothetical protein
MTNDLAPARHRGSYGIDAPGLLAVPAAIITATLGQAERAAGQRRSRCRGPVGSKERQD